MQSLALDVNVVSEEGQRAEMRDEDDDLLRAAEELGIDLSGVRALPGEASDEDLDGEENSPAAEADEDEDSAQEDVVGVEALIEVDAPEDVDLESLAVDDAE
jgi:DNA-directed RNA polymerase subunit beta